MVYIMCFSSVYMKTTVADCVAVDIKTAKYRLLMHLHYGVDLCPYIYFIFFSAI